MSNRDLLWVVATVALGALAVVLIATSVTPAERGLPFGIVLLQSTATIFWIWRSHLVERQQFAMLRERRPLYAEHLRAAVDVIESTQAASSNSLIATGIILSAVVLVHNAARFADPSSNAAELLAVAPKAFTATGFGLVCGLLLMVRAHFGALEQLGRVRSSSPRADDRSEPASSGDSVRLLASVAVDLRTIVGSIEREQHERQQSAEGLSKAVEEVAQLVSETRKQLPKSALGRLASSTEQFSQDVEAVCTAIVELKDVLETQAENIREASGKELRDTIMQQATLSFEAFQAKLVPGFEQKMAQIAGQTEQRIEHIAGAAQESAGAWRSELDSTLNRLTGTIERKAEESFKEVRDQADGYLERRIDVVLNDARVAERNLDGIVEHLRGMNQSLGLLVSGLAETESALKRFAPNGSHSESQPEIVSFLQQIGQLAETVDRVALRFLYEFEALEAKKEKVRALRSHITQALADSSN